MNAAPPPTKLERFLREHRIKPSALARQSGCARQHLVRIRLGRTKYTRPATKQAIAAACSRLSRTNVTVQDLFDEPSDLLREK